MYWGNKIIIYVNNFKTTQVKNIFHFKGERKKFLKNCSLTACAIIFGQIFFLFYHKTFSRGKRKFIYSITTLLSKIEYYLSRLSRTLKLTSL